MMDAQRLQMEKMVLARKLPSSAYVFKDMGTSNPYVVIGAITNSKNVYTIRIDLDSFPNSVPKAFVTKMLLNKDGNRMDSASASMHTLTSEHGFTRICHYGANSWTPMVSIFKIYIKCRLWLEMYEAHLRTGKNIDYFLNHQA